MYGIDRYYAKPPRKPSLQLSDDPWGIQPNVCRAFLDKLASRCGRRWTPLEFAAAMARKPRLEELYRSVVILARLRAGLYVTLVERAAVNNC